MEFARGETAVNSTRIGLLVLMPLMFFLTACGGDGGILKNLASLNPNPIGRAATPAAASLASEAACPVVSKRSLTSDKKSVFDTENKVHFDGQIKKGLTFSGGVQMVSKRQEFLGLKKTNCELSGEWYKKIKIQDMPPVHPSMRRHSFRFHTREDMAATTLEELARSERCILSISAYDGSQDKLLAFEDWESKDTHADKQRWVKDIKLDQAMEEFFHEDYGIKQDVNIGVMDTGVYFFHDDLGDPHLWKQPNGLIGFNGTDPDSDALDSAAEHGAHGTQIAGFISALPGNDTGIMGMFQRNVKLMALKMSDDDGQMSSAYRYNAMEFAAANGADVINMSFGFNYSDTTFKQMIEDYVDNGGFVAVAAGNDNARITSSSRFYPSAWSSSIDGLMGVGSTNSGSETKSGFSNYGTQEVEIFAPGGNVFTTKAVNGNQWGTYYGRTNGTSFSSPILAGAAGLVIGMLKTHEISYTAADIEEILGAGAREVDGLKNYGKQGRYLDLMKLVEEVFERYPEIKTVPEPELPEPPVVVCP